MTEPAKFPEGVLVGKAAVITDTGATLATMRLDGDKGQFLLRDPQGTDVCEINHGGNMFLGGQGASGKEGKLVLYNAKGDASISIRGQSGAVAYMNLGSKDSPGYIHLRNDSGKITIGIDGNKGDITFENGDCAEDFEVGGDEPIDPGTVLILDDEGKVRACNEAYDPRAVGIVSGALGRPPAISLGRTKSETRRVPVGLIGKVFCKVTADFGPIRTGDLLTTSTKRGHAMRATDATRRQGSVVGKALGQLSSGVDMLPVLVMLR